MTSGEETTAHGRHSNTPGSPWRTSYSTVSWAFATKGKKVAKLAHAFTESSNNNNEHNYDHNNDQSLQLMLNTSLPGVRGTLAVLKQYEQDVGFHPAWDESPLLLSMSTSTDHAASRDKWEDIMDDLFSGMPSLSSSVSSAPSSTPTLSPRATPSPTPSTPPPATPAHTQQLNASAHSFIPRSTTPMIKLHKDDQGFYSVQEISFEPFHDDDDDPFVVKPTRKVVADEDGWIGMDKVQRKKDLFEALTKRSRSAQPDKDGWIDVSQPWPKDPKPPRQTPRRHRRKAPSAGRSASRHSNLPPPPPPLPPPMFNPYAKPFMMPAVPYMYSQPMPPYAYGVRMW